MDTQQPLPLANAAQSWLLRQNWNLGHLLAAPFPGTFSIPLPRASPSLLSVSVKSYLLYLIWEVILFVDTIWIEVPFPLLFSLPSWLHVSLKQPPLTGFVILFVVDLPHETGSSVGQGFRSFYSPLWSQHLEKRLAHGRFSACGCWMNAWLIRRRKVCGYLERGASRPHHWC